MIKIKKLTKLMVYFIEKYKININEVHKVALARNKLKSFWLDISVRYFGYKSYVKQCLTRLWWLRNKDGIKTATLKEFKKKHNFNDDDDMMNIKKNIVLNNINNDSKMFYIIKFEMDEWKFLIENCLSTSQIRKKFTSKFDSALSIKLQEFGVKCWLKHSYNWFNESSSAVFWRGKFHCISCLSIFEAIIENNNVNNTESVYIQLTYNDALILTKHEEFMNPDRMKKITGKEREQLGIELLAFGTSNVISNNTVYNFNLSSSAIDQRNLFYFRFF
jgi:hypothetical protein